SQLLLLLRVELSAFAGGAALTEKLSNVLAGFDQVCQRRLFEGASLLDSLLFKDRNDGFHGLESFVQHRHGTETLLQSFGEFSRSDCQLLFSLCQSLGYLVID